MELPIIELLIAAASSLAALTGGLKLLRLRKSVDQGAITVVNKKTGEIATLPRNYSPAAVDKLLEITA